MDCGLSIRQGDGRAQERSNIWLKDFQLYREPEKPRTSYLHTTVKVTPA